MIMTKRQVSLAAGAAVALALAATIVAWHSQQPEITLAAPTGSGPGAAQSATPLATATLQSPLSTVPDTRPHPTPGPPQLSVGRIAIQPAQISSDPSIPSFGAEDVKAYLSAYPPMFSVTKNPQVAKVEFMPASIADRMYHPGIFTTADLSANVLVCVVVLTGDFAMSGPPRQQGGVSGGVTSTSYLMVFDAHSGNLLGEGIVAPKGVHSGRYTIPHSANRGAPYRIDSQLLAELPVEAEATPASRSISRVPASWQCNDGLLPAHVSTGCTCVVQERLM